MNMFKVGLILSVVAGGVVGGSVLAELFHVSGFLLRMSFIVGYTVTGVIALAVCITAGKALFSWIK